MTGVKIFGVDGDMLVSPHQRTPWPAARMERASDEHGVYAYADMSGALDRFGISSRVILAEVEADGDVHVHARGWHADAATITRIFLPLSDWHLRPALLARYCVPIEPLSRLTAPRSEIRDLRLWMAMHYADDMMPMPVDDVADPTLVASIRRVRWRHDRAEASPHLPALYAAALAADEAAR